MPNIITKQTLIDSVRKSVVKVTIQGDGSGDETKYVLYDASSYSPPATSNKLMYINYALENFEVDLYWDATTDVYLMNLLANYQSEQCFKHYGGLINNAGIGKTGDILMSTNGLGAAENGTIIFTVYKKIPNAV